jgi:hypothetical protein
MHCSPVRSPKRRIDVEVRKYKKFLEKVIWILELQKAASSDEKAGVELKPGRNSEESEGFSRPQKIYFLLVLWLPVSDVIGLINLSAGWLENY